MSDTLALQQPVKDGGIRTVNFFNGRMLTARDLGREQEARRQAAARVGEALGHGVARGLYVGMTGHSVDKPVARVGAGLAVNRNGQTLVLGDDVAVALSEAATPDGATLACLFGDCAPPGTGTVVTNSGASTRPAPEKPSQLYLLTIAPAFVSEGRAPMNSSGDGQARCNTDATVEAVQFRLIKIDADFWNRGGSASAGQARNRIAHAFFGAQLKPGWAARRHHAVAGDAARERLWTDDEVPLALIAFSDSFEPLFVDQWSVRRDIGPSDADDSIMALSGGERLITGRAVLRQFEEQMAARRTLAGAPLTREFAWLPAAGVLFGINDAEAATLFDGISVSGFRHIDQADVEPLIRESLTAPVIDTGSDQAVWLYRVAQTQMQNPSGNMLIFASGYLPYRGDARFDLHHWDFANYALTC